MTGMGSGVLPVMAKPVAGERIDDALSGIANSGLSGVVSSLEDHEAFEVGLDNEQDLCEKHGLRFVSYPIRIAGYRILLQLSRGSPGGL